jgi:hypothetical protein
MDSDKHRVPLLPKQIAGYRQWLEELDEEALRMGGTTACDPEVWEYFDPRTSIGRQIYESFSDEELLNVLIRKMNQQGRKPRFDEVHYIYKQYLYRRFNGLNNAKARARSRMKQRREERKWPRDWPERVSPTPLVTWCEKQGQPISQKILQRLQEICDMTRATKTPPQLNQEDRAMLHELMKWDRALEMMGIPALDRAGMRHMMRYWEQQRGQEANLEERRGS